MLRKSNLLFSLFSFILLAGCSTTAKDRPVRIVPTKQALHMSVAKEQLVPHQAFIPVGPNMPTGMERQSLNRFVREIDVLNVLLDEAMTFQGEKRINFLYGDVKRDLSKIKQGVLDYLNAKSTTPRDVKPIIADYRQ